MDTGMSKELDVRLVPDEDNNASYDIEKAIHDLNNQIDNQSSQADYMDYLVAISSGILCGMTDILWTGEFDLTRGRDIADSQIKTFVNKTANMMGCNSDDLTKSVEFLEKKFPIPEDGNTPDFGGGLQHHLRDFAHHPSIVGLLFSLLTQFTEKSYGTDTFGNFIIVPVPPRSRTFIGENSFDKIFRGTVIWFFHLVSDMAGSSNTTAFSGGTGIPGPILSLAKELSSLPIFKSLKADDKTLSTFLSKIFNGTIFAKRDRNGKLIKDSVIRCDLRGELGGALELGRQALPVLANDCLVRCFYFVRRLFEEIRRINPKSLDEIKELDWDKIKPISSPTLTRMLTVATGVFTTIDVADAVVAKKYWVSINYIGVGRFSVALEQEMVNFLKIRDLKRLRKMYEIISRNTFKETDNRIYANLGDTLDTEKFGLTVEQTEILYNLELLKTQNDISETNMLGDKEKIISLKQQWLAEWQKYMEAGFSGFTGEKDAVLHWYDKEELISRIEQSEPWKTWFRLVLLEAMLFEPYYSLTIEKDKKGKAVPSKQYKLQNPIYGYKWQKGDEFLESLFQGDYYSKGYIKRLRKCYKKVRGELIEQQKKVAEGLAIFAAIVVVATATAGMLAPGIAVALVGTNFAGLQGAALTSACLAYLGGGAVAVGGAGMAGGMIAVVGGGAVLGAGVGVFAGGATAATGIMSKEEVILQSAKLLVAVREIFLNDEHDIAYSNSVYEQYVTQISELEKSLVDLRLQAMSASKEEKAELDKKIKNLSESVHAMKIAMKSMMKFNSSFEAGMQCE
ncbi:hypothetical protein HMPREF0620_0931 [Parascardovia denticolens DSM 10105 = JCM 12538]|uniref:Uncharacterized protein n=2 Tax=Parascardovia denticolens TaxID=78258 RepID=E6JYZ1_PARDN|nr:hypothetical protein HMPREF9017_00902 [Parascardovia denticolens F0305]EFT83926.1 hypothetical protein HMPREF0620_0931 [Parascardovia denticolens DSM 10105 = JCM 12538]BAR05225.1 conserved hypothetical protein [Parascardovia denticolens DSM 10105 = JCM 12538]